MKRSFWLVLLFLVIGIGLVGCGSMCGPKKVQEEAPPPPPAIVKPAPQPTPPQPVPPPKKDRN